MTIFETAQVAVAYQEQCQDRLEVINDGDRTIIVVADGAGGSSDGALAAETVIREVRSNYKTIASAEQWSADLRRIDNRISAGETTAVVVDILPIGICGASIGDSQAWLIHEGRLTSLTSHQNRKPLLGSRDSCPIAFSYPALSGVLLVATDGFCNYVKRQELPSVIAQTDFLSIPRTCVELVRLPSGELWDDVGIVACRLQPPRRTRKRFEI